MVAREVVERPGRMWIAGDTWQDTREMGKEREAKDARAASRDTIRPDSRSVCTPFAGTRAMPRSR
jgi:hypothetical protein